MLNSDYSLSSIRGYDAKPMFSTRANSRDCIRNTNPIYVLPGVMEEQAFLKALYENVKSGKISERQADIFLEYLSNKPKYIEEVGEVLIDVGEIPEIPHIESYEFSGKKIPTKEAFVEACVNSQGICDFRIVTEDEENPLFSRISEYAEVLTERASMHMNGSDGTEFSKFERLYFESSPLSTSMPTLPQYLAMVTECAAVTRSIKLTDASVMATFISSIFENGRSTTESCSVVSMCPIYGPVYGEDIIRSDGTADDYEDGQTARNAMSESVSAEVISIADSALYDFSRPEVEALESAASVLLRGGGWFNENGKTYINNPAFDAIANKIFGKIQKFVHMSDPKNPTNSFKRCLNMKRNRYTFAFDDGDETVNDSIRAAVISAGFKPIKDHGKIVRFELSKGGIDVTVEFEDISTGMTISYAKTGSATESVLDDDDNDARPLPEIRQDMTEAVKSFASETSRERVEELMNELTSLEKEYSEAMYPGVPLMCEKTGYLKRALESAVQRSADMHFMSKERVERGVDIFNVVCNNPSNLVYENAVPAITSLYDDSVSAAEFRVISSRLSDAVFRQLYDELACEKVLDKADAAERYMAEQPEASKEEIDEEIKPVITLLNKLGYKTKYSCAGHNRSHIKEDGKDDGVYHGKLYSTARITFAGKYKLPSIPEGWYENLRSDKTAIYVRPFTYDEADGSPEEAFTKWKRKYMENLRNWAENLDPRE